MDADEKKRIMFSILTGMMQEMTNLVDDIFIDNKKQRNSFLADLAVNFLANVICSLSDNENLQKNQETAVGKLDALFRLMNRMEIGKGETLQ